ncbi:MAG TPA: signal peptidase II [Gemmatimonadales bacterium]|jgi:signal peptidase II|nr:signal peptidase II [Gemmatimonadales bacterium]
MTSGGDRRAFWITGVTVVVVDFLTKMVAESALLRTAGLPVLGDWFQLRLVYNSGAAFGLDVGPYSRWIFLAVALIAVVFLYRMSLSTPPSDTFRLMALALVSGGALGNLIDRIRNPQGVVDFLDMGFGVHRWPTFNVADMAISLGAFALAISLWREDARQAAAEEVSQSV